MCVTVTVAFLVPNNKDGRRKKKMNECEEMTVSRSRDQKQRRGFISIRFHKPVEQVEADGAANDAASADDNTFLADKVVRVVRLDRR